MELVHRTRKVSKFAQQDFISSMPDDVITNILHCLPIQDAVRTGILSRNWRFKWTLITKLVFNHKFFGYMLDKGGGKYCGRIIGGLLFHLKDTITKFALVINPYYSILAVEDINNWVMLLSGKGIKNIMLITTPLTPLKLHTHLFSCLELKKLGLMNCCFPPMPCFRGFPNLLKLELCNVIFESCNGWEFLTRCPLLEILSVTIETNCEMRLNEIAKHENLKILSFPLCKLNNMGMITSSDIFQLTVFFPKLQQLYLDFTDCKLLVDTRKRILTALPCLKNINLFEIDFSNGNMVSCAIELICGFPNLESLKIEAGNKNVVPPPEVCFSKVECSRMGQLQLRKVEFLFVRGFENEVCLMKSLLSSSPFLEKMIIWGRLLCATELSKFHRASPIAEIDFQWKVLEWFRR